MLRDSLLPGAGPLSADPCADLDDAGDDSTAKLVDDDVLWKEETLEAGEAALCA